MKRLACTPTTSALADLVAERVVARLDAPRAGRWLTAAEVARRFGIDRSWVYEHRDELRGVRLGGGPRGHLRFDAAKVGEALTAREESKTHRSREGYGASCRGASPSGATGRAVGAAPPHLDD